MTEADARQPAGFGSRWTDEERGELQKLYDEHGRREAAAQFVETHPHDRWCALSD